MDFILMEFLGAIDLAKYKFHDKFKAFHTYFLVLKDYSNICSP